MDAHTARVFVRDTIFDLTKTAVPRHLWYMFTLSDVGIGSTLDIALLAQRLGINPEGLTEKTTLDRLAHKVAAESPLQVRLVRELSPLLLI